MKFVRTLAALFSLLVLCVSPRLNADSAVDAALREAYQEGYKAGHADGYKAGLADCPKVNGHRTVSLPPGLSPRPGVSGHQVLDLIYDGSAKAWTLSAPGTTEKKLSTAEAATTLQSETSPTNLVVIQGADLKSLEKTVDLSKVQRVWISAEKAGP